ncbi:hypothetical protein Tco_0556433 [Tanacetum coccineum]
MISLGLGYGDHRYDGILSYENEVLQSVFMNKESDLANQPLYDRFITAAGMHDVPPPMTRNYMPTGPDVEIDYSQFTYGPKQTQPSESDTQTSEFDTCESNISEETPELVSESVVNKPNVVCQPKVWSDAPIIEEYESDSDDYCVSKPTKEQEQPSFANTNKQVKTPRETVKNHFTHSKNPNVDKKNCDFHEKKMAKQVELNTRKRKDSSQRKIRPTWNNVQRVNHQNQFVPTTVLTRTGKIPVNTARASGTNNVSTARHNFNRQAVPSTGTRKVSTVKPMGSTFGKSLNKTTAFRTKFSNQKVNTAKVNAVSAVGGKRETAVKPSTGCNWRQTRYNWNNDYPHRALQNKGIVDSGCSRHMTGNKAYLAEYQDFNGGPVAFGGYDENISEALDINSKRIDICAHLSELTLSCKKNKHAIQDSRKLRILIDFLMSLSDDSEKRPPVWKIEISLRKCLCRLNLQLMNVHVPLDHFPVNALTKDEGEQSERPSKPLPTPFPPHPSEVQVEPQSDPSPRPSPTTNILDSILKDSGGNQGVSSASEKIPFRRRRVDLEESQTCYQTPQSLDEEYILEAKIGRQEILEEKLDAKGVYELDDDEIDNMESEDAQGMGRTRHVVYEEKERKEKEVITEDAQFRQPKDSTDKEKVSTDRPNEGRSATLTTLTTPTPTIFRDDETMLKFFSNKIKPKQFKRKGIPEAEKKFKQLAHDEEIARKMQEDWETEEERKKLAE